MLRIKNILGRSKGGKRIYGDYIRFLLVDGNDVINALSGIEGGGIDQILARTKDLRARNMGLNASVSTSAAGNAGASASSNRSSEYEEEVVRKRTIHSAAVALLDNLERKRQIKIIGRTYSSALYEDLEENMLVRLEAEIRLHPLHRFVRVSQRWSRFGAKIGNGKAGENDFIAYADEVEDLFR